jgi:CDP-diacylglycerol--glycerol-3-phosphate 3-phosphatidyltransferase
MVVDALGTLAFLHWDLVSPNYFYRVDRLTYNLNWSPPAKAANTSLLLILLFVLPLAGVTLWVATAVAIAQLLVKLYTAHRLLVLATGRGPA